MAVLLRPQLAVGLAAFEEPLVRSDISNAAVLENQYLVATRE
jgi:hypothetical protein